MKVEPLPSGWYAYRWASWACEGNGAWLVTHGPYQTKREAVSAISEERDLAQIPQLLPYRILAEAKRMDDLLANAAYFRGLAFPSLWERLAKCVVEKMRIHAHYMIERQVKK